MTTTRPPTLPDALYVIVRNDRTGWQLRHNIAVSEWRAARHSDGLRRCKPDEGGVLDIALAIDLWASSGSADDQYRGLEVTLPMLQAFRAALSCPVGRLDVGVLDGWACDMAARYNIDLDNETWVNQ
jgi:hypothetical protein